jgi:hypothetical protein
MPRRSVWERPHARRGVATMPDLVEVCLNAGEHGRAIFDRLADRGLMPDGWIRETLPSGTPYLRNSNDRSVLIADMDLTRRLCESIVVGALAKAWWSGIEPRAHNYSVVWHRIEHKYDGDLAAAALEVWKE